MKKKEEEVKKGLPAWQGTFGDLMNLLLCFFVLLFSMSTMDAAKYEEVAASFSSAFGILTGGQGALGDGALIGDGISQLNNLGTMSSSMGKKTSGEATEDNDSKEGDKSQAQMEVEQEQLEASENLASQVTESLQKDMTEQEKQELTEEEVISDVTLNYTSQYVQLTINGSILFDSGSAEVKNDAHGVLNKVGAVLETFAGGTIEIEGHTDNVPIKNSKFASNDELSDARARSVFYYLIKNTGLDPANIKHAGRGDYVPVADNKTAEGRAKNRRVEIRIYNPLSPNY
ncbi:OmpA/MotB family protein [Butyrivibrio sp. NC3005]|jgi:chemotaxis protein MotB|uniref:OmpA/MotB family protein n=1 Tax=Butyrivibrio sp. NC3005 TaxID=1280685 RepID=UPI000415E225|nr:flagellar motor protein MotB [Butyrivibrio sp. NC3005]